MRAFVLSLLFITGCSTKPPEPVIPKPSNDEKSTYIRRIEEVVSDSASALVATTPSLPEGLPRKLIENQTERLSGISKPSINKVKEYERIIRENDSKAAKNDQKNAEKVEQESKELRERVEQAESQLALQELMTAAADEEAQRELKNKQLWQYSTIGVGMFFLGVLGMAFTPFKKNSAVLAVGGMLAMSSAWLFDSEWFSLIAGATMAFIATSVIVLVASYVYNAVKSRYAKDIKQEGEQE